MAKANLSLVKAFRETIENLKKGSPYQWGHMGSCNCGHLAQTICNYSKAEIHAYALSTRTGDWSEQVAAYCPTSSLPLDLLIDTMLEAGLSIPDLRHLERLSDPQILKRLPADKRHLKRNKRDDLILYLQAWANMLEEQLLENISIEEVYQEVVLEKA